MQAPRVIHCVHSQSVLAPTRSPVRERFLATHTLEAFANRIASDGPDLADSASVTVVAGSGPLDVEAAEGLPRVNGLIANFQCHSDREPTDGLRSDRP